MSERATCWSITINNPGKNDEEFIAAARQKGWKVDGQLEKGENGTPHYQLIVRTPQVRFSAVKKAFPRAHIEIARNPTALASYVKKSETREGELPKTESKYPTQAAYFKLVTEELYDVDKDLRIDFTDGTWYRKDRRIDQEQRLLDALDEATSLLIRRGYHVETLAVNPQTRSAWKKFGMDIINRSQAEIYVDRQTDRQTGIISVAEDIQDAEEGNDTESASGEEQEDDTEGEGQFGTDPGSGEEDSSGDESSEESEDDSEQDGGD